MGVVVVSAGEWRRRRLPVCGGVRPTPLRLRQMLFNWLGQDMTGWRCLDLFAGSGALGIEALSRGAEYVTFIERDLVAYRQLLANLSILEVPKKRFQVIHSCAHYYIKNYPPTIAAIDLFFADPPFHRNMQHDMFPDLCSWLTRGSLMYWEAEQFLPWSNSVWNVLQQKKVSQSHAVLLQYSKD